MIAARPFDDFAALAVFRQLDPHDLIEAAAVRGGEVTHLSLWFDWRAMEGARVLSRVIEDGGQPFAVLALSHTGQAGVAGAAMLARDHRRFARPLAALAARIRRDMPAFCAGLGIHRVEARCWAAHPTAALLLTRLGFAHEADMPGFGRTGRETFRQFAWTAPHPAPHPVPPKE